MASPSLTFQAQTLDDTDRFGAALARVLPNGTTVCLSGTLGAGKTRLVQAIAAACDIDPENVVSPTFVLCSHYAGSRKFNHLDAYRINDDDEFLDLGVDEMFGSDDITLVEWGERVRDCLPRERIDILIEVLGDTAREFQVQIVGKMPTGLLDALQNAIDEACT